QDRASGLANSIWVLGRGLYSSVGLRGVPFSTYRAKGKFMTQGKPTITGAKTSSGKPESEPSGQKAGKPNEKSYWDLRQFETDKSSRANIVGTLSARQTTISAINADGSGKEKAP